VKLLRYPDLVEKGLVHSRMVDRASDRKELLRFAKAVNTSVAPRRDGCGDYVLRGRFGHISATGARAKRQFQIVVGTEPDVELTRRKWLLLKTALSFCKLTQDGDTEGSFLLDRLPDLEEAAVIRKYLGLRKLRQSSEQECRNLRDLSLIWGFQPKIPAETTPAVPVCLPPLETEKAAASDHLWELLLAEFSS
jgi:hypothetical protein